MSYSDSRDPDVLEEWIANSPDAKDDGAWLQQAIAGNEQTGIANGRERRPGKERERTMVTYTARQQRIQFFREHAGYSTPPGRLVCAKNLADAEEYANTNDWVYEWHDDPEPWDSDIPDYTPSEVLGCILRDADRNILAALFGIADPDQEYRRVVEAELAYEAIGTPRFRTAREDIEIAAEILGDIEGNDQVNLAQEYLSQALQKLKK